MNRQTEAIWEKLRQAGLVQGIAPDTALRLESPWYVKALLAFSGWLAALFILGVFGTHLEFVLDNHAVSFVVGGLMIGAAFAFLRQLKNAFIEHLALATSLAGQALVVWALFNWIEPHFAMAWACVAILQLTLAVAMPNFVHRVLSSFGGACALSMALADLGEPFIIGGAVLFFIAWIWLNEFRFPRHTRTMQAIGYGLVLALVLLKGSVIFSTVPMFWLSTGMRTSHGFPRWMGELSTGAVAFYVVWQLLRRQGQPINGRPAVAALLGTLLIGAASLKAGGISAGMVILLLGHAGGNRVLMGLGISSLLYFVSSYYYLLHASLLVKAQALGTVGLVLLAVRWAMWRLLPAEKAV